MNLFLDDIRFPEEVAEYIHPDYADIYLDKKWDIVRSYNEFVSYINNNDFPELISFDHDLGDVYHFKEDNKLIINPLDAKFDYQKYSDNEKTGYHCAKWLVNYCIDKKIPLPKFIVHSKNSVGADNIIIYLKNAYKHINHV